LVDGVVGADEEVRANLRQLLRGGQHQLGYALPILALDILHLIAEGVRVQGYLGMLVRSEDGLTLDAHGFVTKGGALGSASDNAHV
jgi:hypothetical protein